MSEKFNLKKILIIVVFVALLIFITVLTWIPLNFDIDNLDFNKWFTNSLINVGIMIAGILLGEVATEDKLKEKIDGLYQKALKAYKDIKKKLTEDLKIVVYFSQWYLLFKAKELKLKKEGYLVDNNINQLAAHLIVEYIEKDDLDEMVKRPFVKVDEKTKKEIKFKKISEEEKEIILKIFQPDFTLDAPNYTYYLSAFGDSSSVSTLEQAKKLEEKESSNKTFNRVFKIALSLFISILWGMATVDELTSGGIKEAVANTITRTIALFGGLLSGVLTAVISIRLASQKLENKTEVLTFMELDYENKEFVPKTYEQIVEEEFKKEQVDNASGFNVALISSEQSSEEEKSVPNEEQNSVE